MAAPPPTHLRAPFFHVSSFTATAAGLLGNPAGVVLLEAAAPPPPDAACLRAAGELGLSETAFLTPTHPPGAPPAAATEFSLRWFSPTKEVALCGHGTLAAAHALTAGLGNPHALLTFHTLSGPLQVRTSAASAASAGAPAVSMATMDFPANDPLPAAAGAAAAAAAVAAPAPALAEVARLLLGAQHGHLLESCHYSARARKAVLVLAPGSAAAIAALRPTGEALLGLAQDASVRIEGVSVACASGGGGGAPGLAALCCRYWSPWNGLPGPAGEDPANGSSHTLLAPLFARLLGVAEGEELASTHLSARGGRLHVAVAAGGERVTIRGEATTVCQGHMWIAL
jgi:predicted PhzF superfamily epimerase YddE/YHI9